jgi:hypothetical protein
MKSTEKSTKSLITKKNQKETIHPCPEGPSVLVKS